MRHAFPRDELRPLSCAGHVRAARRDSCLSRSRGAPQDTLGGYALTLVDALDSIALMGARSAAASAAQCSA